MSAGTDLDASWIAKRVRQGRLNATAATRAWLDSVATNNGVLNCFTALLSERALVTAEAIDEAVARGCDPGPLAGVPFAVKSLFDVAGLVTVSGSKIHRNRPPATRDAYVVRRLIQAGAIPVGLTNMDEYAYGFVTENAHTGTTRNPRNPAHMAGGSSGGSAAAVAAGLVPIALGSDTNGSVRVPAAFCGVFGLKPTYGRLSRQGLFPFVNSLDHVGLFARNAADLAGAYDAMQGSDPDDPAQADRAFEPTLSHLDESISGLRVGVLDGWFQRGAAPQALAAVERVAGALGACVCTTLPEAEVARAAAFCITASEGANVHLANLQKRPHDFDPATRDRLLAGALLPAAVVLQAQRFRRWFFRQVIEAFSQVDVLLAPCTPSEAPALGQVTMRLAGVDVPVRANIGIYTQPLSFVGLPVVVVPIQRPDALPLGVQIVVPPWEEGRALRVAAWLEGQGVAAAPVARAANVPTETA